MNVDWVYKYIGLKYKDASWGPEYYDCWGLMALVYRDEFGIDIVEDITLYSSRMGKIERYEKYKSRWLRVDEPEIGDGILFLIGGKVPHCGIYIGNNRMLHSIEGVMSCIQRINDTKWKSRFEGYYTYRKRNSQG